MSSRYSPDPEPQPVEPIKRRLSYHLVYPVIKPLVSTFLLLLFGLRGYHVQRAVGLRNYILLGNHQSYLDPMFLGSVSPRATHYMARDNLFRPGLKQLIELVGSFPVVRGRRDERAFKHAHGLLATGESVVIFGEGTRSPHGNMQPIRGGVEILARRTHATILPMVLDGPYQMAPRTRSLRYLQPVSIHVVVGEPIQPQEYLAWPHREIPARLQTRFEAMLEEVRNRRARAGRNGLITFTRPVIEGMAAYYRVLHGLLTGLLFFRRKKRKPAATPAATKV